MSASLNGTACLALEVGHLREFKKGAGRISGTLLSVRSDEKDEKLWCGERVGECRLECLSGCVHIRWRITESGK